MQIFYSSSFVFSKNEEPKDATLVKIEAVNAQVDEAKEVVNQNLELMMERGEKLEDLEHKTGKQKSNKENANILTFYFSLRGDNDWSRSFSKKYQSGR